jgi:ferric-dicitrate binding protein FerR (iron transport regulator)
MIRRSTLMRTVRALPGALAFAVCLFPLQAQDPNATVLEMTGQVSVISGTGGYQTALSKGSIVRQQQMIVTGPDGYAQFRVSDGSTFEVFPKSRVVFRQNLGNWKELLDIFLGRVKVLIYHAPGQVNHNSVSSPTAVISVRGTVFDVVVEDDDTTVVSVDEGLVGVRNTTSYQATDMLLKPGDSVRISRGVPLIPAKIDKTRVIQKVLIAGRDAIWQVILGKQVPVGVSGAGGGVGAQGDRGKPSPPGTGNTNKGPGAPTTGPGAPSQGPGSGGN